MTGKGYTNRCRRVHTLALARHPEEPVVRNNPSTTNRRRFLRPAVTAVVLLAAGASPAVVANMPASAETCPISVSTFGHDLAAAQKALNSVTPTCRTIVFRKGTYVFNDKFRVSTPAVKVTGEPGAVIQAVAGTAFLGGLIQVTGTDVTVSGLTIIGSPDKGIEVHRTTKFTVSDNVIRNSYKLGIHVLGSDGGTVTNNTVAGNRNNGIDSHGSTYVVIRGNKVYRNGAPRNDSTGHYNEGNGIIAYCSQHIDILSNTIYNNSQGQPGVRDGIRLSDSHERDGQMPTRYITVDGNLVYDNQSTATQGYAIRIGGNGVRPGEGTITFVTVTNNTGYGNLYAGIGTNGLAPNATFVQANNQLKGRH